MELITFLTRNEPVAGFEVTDDSVRFLLLKTKKSKTSHGDAGKSNPSVFSRFFHPHYRFSTEVKIAAEESLKEGTVVNGVLKDHVEFVKTIKNLLKKTNATVRYVIVSLPTHKVYSRTYTFPKTIDDEKINDSMHSVVAFQLPLKQEDIYLNWEKTDFEDEKTVVVAGAQQTVVNEYLVALLEAGLYVVAVEFHPVSAARVVVASDKNAFDALVLIHKDSFTISIIKQGVVRFSRVIPRVFCEHKDGIVDEVRKVVDFYESEKQVKVTRIALLGEAANVLAAKKGLGWSAPAVLAEPIDHFSERLYVSGEQSNWLVVLGAAVRGNMSRSADNLISLMPVGTRQAYERQKALAFGAFLSNVIVGLSLFFTLVFLGSWILTVSLQQSYVGRIAVLKSTPLPTDAVGLENQARNFNEVIAPKAVLLRTFPRWSLAIARLQMLVGPGITISSFSTTAPGTIIITGSASTRAGLKQFKKALEDSPLFSSVSLPISNLAPRENVSFSASFISKDLAVTE